MPAQEIHVAVLSSTPREHVEGLREDFHQHFGGILCFDHMASLQVAFRETARGLVCHLSACCAPAKEQLHIHRPCAEEIAAIYGLSVIWSPAN